VRLKFLVDSGALYSVVPTPVLRRLGIKPGKTKSFILADGTEIKRSLGQALFRMNGDEAASPVIFGEEGDSTLLGSVSLEALGLMLDPFKRELRPLPMILASHRPAWNRALLSPQSLAPALPPRDFWLPPRTLSLFFVPVAGRS
jgi:predicted aspartyl protease